MYSRGKTAARLNNYLSQVIVNGNLSIRGPHLLPLVRAMPRLLDLSLALMASPSRPANTSSHHSTLTNTLTSPLSTTLNSPLSNTLLRHHSPHITAAPTPMSSHHEPASSQSPVLQDPHTKALFAMIAASFPSLKRINMSGWSFSLDNCNKVN